MTVPARAAESSRRVAARGGLFGIQGGALETFDAFVRGSSMHTWCASARMDPSSGAVMIAWHYDAYRQKQNTRRKYRRAHFWDIVFVFIILAKSKQFSSIITCVCVCVWGGNT